MTGRLPDEATRARPPRQPAAGRGPAAHRGLHRRGAGRRGGARMSPPGRAPPAPPRPPADMLRTAGSIAAAQRPDGALPWPDGHVDPWDHVECAMALSACGLTAPARLAYQWLLDTQRADGSWPRTTGGPDAARPGAVADPAAE